MSTTSTDPYPVTHRACGKPHRPMTPCPLTPDQLDGLACVGCGSLHGAMRPVGTVDGGQVFAHDGCDEGGDLTDR